MTDRAHSFLRTAIIIGFTILIARLIYTGDLYYYLAPRLHMLAYVTEGILVLLSVMSIKQLLVGKQEDACDCGEAHSYSRSFLRSTLIYALFVLPLVMGFCLPNKYLGSAVAEQKGVHIVGTGKQQLAAPAPTPTQTPNPVEVASTTKEADPAKPAVPNTQPKAGSGDQQIHKMFSDKGFGDFYADIATTMYKQPVISLNDKTFLDGLTILDLFLEEFNQKKLETYGFVYRDPSFKSTQFVVARFSISCCTADATVSGVMVNSKDAKKYANDSWVKVKGTLKKVPYNGNDMLMLEASEITPVKAPKDPYVYYSAVTPQPIGQ